MKSWAAARRRGMAPGPNASSGGVRDSHVCTDGNPTLASQRLGAAVPLAYK